MVLVQWTSLLASTWWAHNWIYPYLIASSLGPHPPLCCLQYRKKGVARAWEVWSCEHKQLNEKVMLFNQLHSTNYAQYFECITTSPCWLYTYGKFPDIFVLLAALSPLCPHTLSIKGFLPFFLPWCSSCDKTYHVLYHISVLQAMKSWAGGLRMRLHILFIAH